MSKDKKARARELDYLRVALMQANEPCAVNSTVSKINQNSVVDSVPSQKEPKALVDQLVSGDFIGKDNLVNRDSII